MNTNDHVPASLSFAANLDRAAMPAEGGTGALMIRIRGGAAPGPAHRTPVDIAFVLDRSGSMSGDPLRLVKEAAGYAITNLQDQDRASLVVFDHDVDLLQPLAPTTDRIKTAMRLTLHGIDSRGSTNLSGGWFAGCEQLAAAMATDPIGPTRVRRTLLLTDGHANNGIVDPSELSNHASNLRQRGIATTTMGVGEGFDEVLLSGMAEAGGGNFEFIATPSQLRGFFEREIGELLATVATNVTLRVTMPDGMHAEVLSAYPRQRTGRQFDLSIGDLTAGQDAVVIFWLTGQQGSVGSELPIHFSVRWTNPQTGTRATEPAETVLLTRADDRVYQATPVIEEVAATAAVQRASLDQREAMRLDRAGRHAESRQMMRNSHANLMAAPPSPEVAEMALMFDDLAEAPLASYSEETYKRTSAASHRRLKGKSGN